MPTYEYRCPDGHHFELFQKMSDEPRAECPVCGRESQRLLSGGAGFVFKGAGFYATDYRSDSYTKDASREKPKEESKDSPAGGSPPDSPGKGGSTSSSAKDAEGKGPSPSSSSPGRAGSEDS